MPLVKTKKELSEKVDELEERIARLERMFEKTEFIDGWFSNPRDAPPR